MMPVRLVNMFVKNVAAVDKPANRRKFLVIKSAEGVVEKTEHAMTFDDAMMGRRLNKIYMALSEHYGALIETIDSIRRSEDEDKGAQVKKALADFAGSIPKMVARMEEEHEEVEKAGRKISADRMSKLKMLHKTLEEIIAEQEGMMEKKGLDATEKKAPDATALSKIGHTIAAMFGRAAGADEDTIAELEKAAGGEQEPQIPAEVQTRLSKAEAENVALKTRVEKAEQETARLREETELRKFTEEVAGFKDIGLDPAKDAALLRAVTEKLPKEQSDRIREIFKSAVAQAAASKLFTEVGSGGFGTVAGSVSEQIEQRCDALMSKSDKLTRERARDRVFREDPSLYERWRQETSVKI